MIPIIELKIDPEFRDKIPPLTDAEFEQLEENILNDKEVYEPICVWNGTIVDGHNRWKIIQKHPEISFRTKEMDFADKFEAFDWMYRKQLGRRNLTDEQRTLLIGQMYEARKNGHGGDRKSSIQNGNLIEPHGRIGEQIAKELGIGNGTVLRAGKFKSGFDKLNEVSPDAANKILNGNSGATKSDVMALQNKTEEEVKEFADSIVSGEIKAYKKRNPIDQAERKLNKQINEAINASIEAVRGESKYEYTLADALDELSVLEKEFVSKVRRVFEVRNDLIKGNDLARETVNSWKYDIDKLKGEI